VPKKKVIAREEYMVAACCVDPEEGLLVVSGGRTMTLKGKELEHYRGERGQRGLKLPRGWREVERLMPAPSVETAAGKGAADGAAEPGAAARPAAPTAPPRPKPRK
jgi:hypothetical protein